MTASGSAGMGAACSWGVPRACFLEVSQRKAQIPKSCSASQPGPWAAPLTPFQAAWEPAVSHGALPWAQGGAVMPVLLSGVY